MGRLDQTPNPVWSDGVHFVRRAAASDAHEMRWVAGAHRTTKSTLNRHFESMDAAISGAMHASRVWIAAHPADKAVWVEATLPAASSLKGIKRVQGRAAKPKLEAFATTHFNCIHANPYAQVWQCVSGMDMKSPTGRRKAGGQPPTQTPFRHELNQCSVLIGPEPVRNDDGTVRIFSVWQEAEEYAIDLYDNAPADEVISWSPGDYRVGSTQHCDIRFFLNRDRTNTAKPFSLWLPAYDRYVYKDRTRPMHFAETNRKSKANSSAQEQIDDAERRRERSRLTAVPSYAEDPLTFRSIWEAEKEAYRRDAMIRGEVAA